MSKIEDMFAALDAKPTNAGKRDDLSFANTSDIRKTDTTFAAKIINLCSQKGSSLFELCEDRNGKKHSAFGKIVRGDKDLLDQVNATNKVGDIVVVRIVIRDRTATHPKDGTTNYPWVEAIED
jgi:hypothetical protein